MKFYPTPCWAQLHRRLSVHGLIVALVTVLLLIGNLDVVDGQTIGVDICACSPPTYKITFDFSLTCPPTNVGADGLASSSCLIGPFGDPNTSDFVPVFASEITFVEVGQDTSILVTSDITGDFANGSSIEYAALSSNPDRISNPNQVTRALRVTIIGTNAVGQDLVNVFILTFNNNCSVFPVIRPSENAGWAVFEEVGVPDESVCAAAAGQAQLPTNPPLTAPEVPANPETGQPTSLSTTSGPTLPPTVTPETDPPTTLAPTSSPTSPPTITLETDPPATLAPTSSPTAQPNITATGSPTTVQQTDAPSQSLTVEPATETPSLLPSVTPSWSPSISPSERLETIQPSVSPTNETTAEPSTMPSPFPTNGTTTEPTLEPTTLSPTALPGNNSTTPPTSAPSDQPVGDRDDTPGPTGFAITDPPPPECFMSTTEILNAQLRDPPIIDIEICPGTMIPIGTPISPAFDRFLGGDIPLTVVTDNVTIRCGRDGAPSNNCVMMGGHTQVLVVPNSPFVEGVVEANNLTIQGLTFTGVLSNIPEIPNHSVVVSAPGRDIRIVDCSFLEMEADHLVSIGVDPLVNSGEILAFSTDVTIQDSTFAETVYSGDAILLVKQSLQVKDAIFENLSFSDCDCEIASIIHNKDGNLTLLDSEFSTVEIYTSIVYWSAFSTVSALVIERSVHSRVSVFEKTTRPQLEYCERGLLIDRTDDGKIGGDCRNLRQGHSVGADSPTPPASPIGIPTSSPITMSMDLQDLGSFRRLGFDLMEDEFGRQ